MRFWPGTKVGISRPPESTTGAPPDMTGSPKNTNPVEDCELPPVRQDVNCSPPTLKSCRPQLPVDMKYDSEAVYWRLLRSSGSLESKYGALKRSEERRVGKGCRCGER